VRLLGEGGFAQVYLAEHTFLKKQAAIKVLHGQVTEDALETFLGEAQTIARLEHPHIVRILDFGVENKIPFLVMSYAPNGTLRQRHCEGSRLPLSTIVSYLTQIAPALQYAHTHKVIHRDIKPQNMLIGLHDELLLSDFGIAIVFESTSFQSTQNQAGTSVYMAPEQYQGKPRPASDQYALGVVVYEWLCGERPFQGTQREIEVQHLAAAPPPLREKAPHVSVALEQVVLKALAKDRKERFASVQDFADAFEQACQSPPPALIRTPLQPSPRSPISPPQQPSTDAVTTPQQSVVPPQSAPTSNHTPLSLIATPVSSRPLSTSVPVTPPGTMLKPSSIVNPSSAPTSHRISPASPLPPQPTISPRRKSFFNSKPLLLMGLTFIVIIGSVGLLYPAVINYNANLLAAATVQARATATAQVRATPTTQDPAIATAQVRATAIAAARAYAAGTSNGVMFGFDPQHMNFNPYEKVLNPANVSRLVQYWTASTGNTILSSPAVANGVVYVGSFDGKLYAFHLPGTTP
jgi:serine/threonine protein kinase